MKIKDYIAETDDLVKKFYQASGCRQDNETNLLVLFDAIELREGEQAAWRSLGLTEEDEVPQATMKLIFPTFTTRVA